MVEQHEVAPVLVLDLWLDNSEAERPQHGAGVTLRLETLRSGSSSGADGHLVGLSTRTVLVVASSATRSAAATRNDVGYVGAADG